MSCTNNLKQIGLALHNYHGVHQKFPPGWTTNTASTNRSWGWSTYLLPYMEQQNMYTRLNPDGRTFQQVLQTDVASLQVPIKSFVCPSDTLGGGLNTNRKFMQISGTPAIALSNYPGNGGNDGNTGLFQANTEIAIKDITDGTSNTIAVGERKSRDNAYAALWAGMSTVANENDWGPSGSGETSVRGYTLYRMPEGFSSTVPDWPDAAFSSNHTGGANFAMCDGSVRFISYTINWTQAPTPANKATMGTFNKLGDRADAQPVGDF
jgi:prepilin-type processing-associated H-X9-DG protein